MDRNCRHAITWRPGRVPIGKYDMSPPIRLAALLIAGAAATIAHPALATSYQYTTITNSALPSDTIYPEGINDSNVVVGTEYGTPTTGFVWQNGTGQAIANVAFFGGINDNGIAVGGIGNSTGGPELGFYNIANGSFTTGTIELPKGGVETAAINIGGDVAGEIFSHDKRTYFIRGFLYSASGKTTHLSLKKQNYCYAYGINDSGEIVGNCSSYSGNPSAYLYSNGTYTTLTVPGSTSATPYFITNGGVIGGQAIIGSAYVGFVYAGGTYTTYVPDLANVRGYTSVLQMLNNGNLVGRYLDTAGFNHGFLYNAAAQKYYSLDVPGSVSTQVYQASPSGSFVGVYYTSATGPAIGFVATCAAGKFCN